MSNRARNAQIAQDTLQILEAGRYSPSSSPFHPSSSSPFHPSSPSSSVDISASLRKAVEGSVLYSPGDFTPSFLAPPSLQKPQRGRECLFTFEQETSLQAAHRLHRAAQEQQRKREEERRREERALAAKQQEEHRRLREEQEKDKLGGKAPPSDASKAKGEGGKGKVGGGKEGPGLAEAEEEEEEHMVVLNFASAKNPGGGFLKGSQAQEESLARSSGLYPCIAQKGEMYRANLSCKTCAYLHYMIFSPHVPVFKNDAGNLLPEPYLASFLTAPAPNAGVIRTRVQQAEELINKTLEERIDRLLAVCLHHRCTTLVLGAYGCGVFGNHVASVARVFARLLSTKYRLAFRQAHFAVPDRLAEFRRAFEAAIPSSSSSSSPVASKTVAASSSPSTSR